MVMVMVMLSGIVPVAAAAAVAECQELVPEVSSLGEMSLECSGRFDHVGG